MKIFYNIACTYRTMSIALSCLMIYACNNDIEKIKLFTEKENLPIETGKNVFINYTDSGRPRAKVYAPILQRFADEEKNETIMPKGVTVYFLDKNERIESYMKARYAIRYERERKMTGKNDVVLVNIKGDTLRTELLNWDELNQRLYTDQYVRINTKTESLAGYGFESNTEFTRYKFNKISGNFSM